MSDKTEEPSTATPASGEESRGARDTHISASPWSRFSIVEVPLQVQTEKSAWPSLSHGIKLLRRTNEKFYI